MRVLVSGAGIAGLTLAYWLLHYGHGPVIVERAPALRTGGYVIDFWGSGFEVADRMGIASELREDGYLVREVRAVNGKGERTAWFPADAITNLAPNRYVSLPRGDLAARIYESLQGQCQTIFGESIHALRQTKAAVEVEFSSGTTAEYDLVVGADGLHSRVRELTFGPEKDFERYLGYKVAVFESAGYEHRDDLVYVMYTEVGQQLARFTLRGNRTMFLFIYSDPDPGIPEDLESQKQALIRRFQSGQWETREILRELESASTLYYDRVSQIRMPERPNALRWSENRVSLVGDAAWCASLLAGEGSALAMTGAYILAGELARSPEDLQAAFRRYEELFLPVTQRKQKGAVRFANTFAPHSRFSLLLRNLGMNLLRVPGFTRFLVGRELGDHIELPTYQDVAATTSAKQ